MKGSCIQAVTNDSLSQLSRSWAATCEPAHRVGWVSEPVREPAEGGRGHGQEVCGITQDIWSYSGLQWSDRGQVWEGMASSDSVRQAPPGDEI